MTEQPAVPTFDPRAQIAIDTLRQELANLNDQNVGLKSDIAYAEWEKNQYKAALGALQGTINDLRAKLPTTDPDYAPLPVDEEPAAHSHDGEQAHTHD
jgi:chromosome segregation ATPase